MTICGCRWAFYQTKSKSRAGSPSIRHGRTLCPHFKTFIRENYKDNPKVWLDELAKLCEKRYAQEYRELGVARFYETKEGDRKEHLREIIARMSKDLIEDWRNGVKSMYDIRRLLDALVGDLGAAAGRRWTIKSQRPSKMRRPPGKRRRTMRIRWAHMGIISTALGGRDRLFDAQAAALEQQYVYRTNIGRVEVRQRLAAGIDWRTDFPAKRSADGRAA